MKYKNFAREIKCIREEMNMTQQEFAEKLGYSPKAISSWERGLTCPYAEGLAFKTLLMKKTDKDLTALDNAVRKDIGILESDTNTAVVFNNLEGNNSIHAYVIFKSTDKTDYDNDSSYIYMVMSAGGLLMPVCLLWVLTLIRNHAKPSMFSLIVFAVIILMLIAVPIIKLIKRINAPAVYKPLEVELSMENEAVRKNLHIKTIDSDDKNSFDVILKNYTVAYIEPGILAVTEHPYKIPKHMSSDMKENGFETKKSYYIWLLETEKENQELIIKMLLNRSKE